MNKNGEKYNYINIIEEKLNNDINPIDDKILIDIYKQKADYNQLKQANSFQGIQDILRQMRRNANLNNYFSTPLSNQKPVSQASSQAIPTTQTDLQRATNIPSPTSNGSSLQGITINFRNRLWGSPRDYSGTVYQFNRGAIGISGDGKIATSIIDQTDLHHNDATRQVSSELGFPSNRLNSTPFEAGEEAAHTSIDAYFNDHTDGGVHPDVADAVRAMEAGQVSDPIETEDGWYVVQRVSDYDEDATADNLEAMTLQAKEDYLLELEAQWQEETPLVIEEEVWDAVRVDEMLTEA